MVAPDPAGPSGLSRARFERLAQERDRQASLRGEGRLVELFEHPEQHLRFAREAVHEVQGRVLREFETATRRTALQCIDQPGFVEFVQLVPGQPATIAGLDVMADWDTRYEIYRGATFNLAHTLDQMLHLRPHNRFEDLDGMYLVGGGTHPGSGLPVIFESARISSKLLLQDLGVGSSSIEHPLCAETSEPRSNRVMAEAVQAFARMLNLKTAPIASEPGIQPSRKS